MYSAFDILKRVGASTLASLRVARDGSLVQVEVAAFLPRVGCDSVGETSVPALPEAITTWLTSRNVPNDVNVIKLGNLFR